MIRRLVRPFEHAHFAFRIGRGLREDAAQLGILHVVRTGVGREHAPGHEPPHRAKIDFLVAAQGAFERALGFRKGRRIEDDHVPQRFDVTLGCVEPVEDVRDLEFGGDSVAFGVSPCRRDGIFGAVQAQYLRRPRPRRSENEP